MNNWHKTPNYIYDAYSEMKEAELRLTVWLVRHTYGFHRDNVQATSKEIQKATGLSKQGLINAQNAVQERGFFVRVDGGYLVNEVDQEVNQVDQKEAVRGQRSRPTRSTKLTTEVNEVDQTGQLSRPSASSPKESFKESIKEKEKENLSPLPQKPIVENSPYEPTEQQLATVYAMNGFTPSHPVYKAFKDFKLPSANKIIIAAHDVTAAGVEPEQIPLFLEYWSTVLGERSKPYPSQLVNNLEPFKEWLAGKKESTPAVLSPSVVMAHVNAIKDLSDGTYKEAVSRLPDNVRAIMSQALRVSRKVGFNTLAESDITAVMVKE